MSSAVKTIADMSAPLLRVVPQRTARQEQNRRAKQAQRERDRAAGIVAVELKLSTADAQLVEWLRGAQAGNPETFDARALVIGAKFLYNAGNVKGGKRRIKGSVPLVEALGFLKGEKELTVKTTLRVATIEGGAK